ncbi:MAG: TMEM165/GDT1 family protein [Alphaproteobacteria bacterium]|nr:TMEM165/GDT1 family protein [Alphaproteobacteria bacterium]
MTAILTVFLSVLLVEMGDKTQLATALFAADGKLSPALIFVASSAALIVTSAIAVFVGTMAREYLDALPLKLLAGLAFIAIGALNVWSHFNPSP